MKEIKFMNLQAQNALVREQIIDSFIEVLDSGSYVSGKKVENFERAFASAHDSAYSIACNSGTTALEITLKALDIGPGDEVIIPALTFVATMEAVVAVGATPVLVDVDPISWNLMSTSAEKALSRKTKAMIFVHLHGSAVGIEEAVKFCESNNIFLIEDAAQAHLGAFAGTSVGKFGIAAAFSFYPGKNLGALGEGGAIVTDSEGLRDKAQLIRNWGAKQKYKHEIRGSNYRMDEVQAAFLSIKLQILPQWTAKRRNLAKIYDGALSDMQIHIPFNPTGDHVYHIYAICIENRDKLVKELNTLNIQTGIHYPQSLDSLSAWEGHFKKSGSIENAPFLASRLLSLPLNESLEDEDILYVVDNLSKILE